MPKEKRKSRLPPPRTKPRVASKPFKPPKNWRDTWDLITEMRKDRTAAVDLPAFGIDLKCVTPENRFQTLIGLMLSSQTKDETTAKALAELQKQELTPENVLKMKESEIVAIIKSVRFCHTKARNMKRVAEIINDKHHGITPTTYEEIISLPGIGPKMTYLYLQFAVGLVEGIAVDLHVHRISNRLGWAKSTTPESTRVQLESWMPKELWGEVSTLLAGFGQQICDAKLSHCSTCLLFGKGLCSVRASRDSARQLRGKAKQIQVEQAKAEKGEETDEEPEEEKEADPESSWLSDIEDTQMSVLDHGKQEQEDSDPFPDSVMDIEDSL